MTVMLQQNESSSDVSAVTKLAKPTEPGTLVELWNPKRNSVAETLARQPQAFDFFQAVLLLERILSRGDTTVDSVPSRPIGKFHRIDQEAIRISAPATSAFPTAQIEQLTIDQDNRPRMLVNFMGLTGPSGMLPRTYTQLLAQVNRDGRGDERYALRDFLDQFNHRLISLFFVAWTKYRFPVRMLRDGSGETLMEVALAAVAGLPSYRASTSTQLAVKPAEPSTIESEANDSLAAKPQLTRAQLLGFAGMLAQRPATAGNLQAILGRVLEVPVRVLQFQPSILELDDGNQTCLGVDNGCGKLGLSAVVGPRTMTRQHKISIQIGPVGFERFLEFLPGDPPGPGFLNVSEIVRTCVGHSLDYDLNLAVCSSEVTGCRLENFCRQDKDHAGSSVGHQAESLGSRLGFDSWLHSDEWPQTLNDAVISAV
jgi:type VI secretion system protein ImpH